MLEELASETPGATAVHDLLARLRLASGQVDRARQHAARAAGEAPAPTPSCSTPASCSAPATSTEPSGNWTASSRSTRTASPWPRCEPGS